MAEERRICKLCGQRCPEPDDKKRHAMMGDRGPEMILHGTEAILPRDWVRLVEEGDASFN